ncbi:hypothetical protein FOZ62_009651, partial [Perkinsus olseni]
MPPAPVAAASLSLLGGGRPSRPSKLLLPHFVMRRPYHLVSYYYPLLAAPFDDPPGFSSSSSSTAIAGPYSSGLPLPPPPSAAVYVFFYASTLDGVVPLVDYSWSSAPLSWIPLLEVESYSSPLPLMGSSTRSRTRSRSPAGSGSTVESTASAAAAPRGEGRVRGSMADDVVPRPSSRHQRQRSRSRDGGVERRRRSSTDEHYYREGGGSGSSSRRNRYGPREPRGSSPSRGYSFYPEDRHRRREGDNYRRRDSSDYRRRDGDDYRRRDGDDYRRRDGDDYRRRDSEDYRPRRREDRSDRPGGGGSYYDVRTSRAPSDSSSLHYVNSSSRETGGIRDVLRPDKQGDLRTRTDDNQVHHSRGDSRPRHRESSRPSPKRQVGPEESPTSPPLDVKAQPVVPARKPTPVVEFGKAIRQDPRATVQKGNVLELSCDCPRKYVPDAVARPLRDPAWLSSVKWEEATFEERIMLRREFAPRAVANAR